jgi:hypothetical protein
MSTTALQTCIPQHYVIAFNSMCQLPQTKAWSCYQFRFHHALVAGSVVWAALLCWQHSGGVGYFMTLTLQ